MADSAELVYSVARMNKFRHQRLKSALPLFAALLLRAAIPAGFMPAAAGSGLLFEFCPEGIPAEFIQLLTGDAGHESGHTVDGHPGNDADPCSLGHMLLSVAAVDDAPQPEDMAAAPTPLTFSAHSFTSVSRTHYTPAARPPEEHRNTGTSQAFQE